MTAQIINIAELRIRRAQARHNIGTAAAVIYALPLRDTEPPGELLAREARNQARLTRARLVQEAIDEAIADGTPCDYETIMGVVAQWEQILQECAK